ALTGRKIRVMDSGEISRLSVANEEFAREAEALQPAGGEQPQGWGVEYDYHEEIYESEQTSFVARGEIRTADGRVLQFDLALHMSREFYQQTSVSFRAGDAVRKDPLVINFDGTAAELSDFKFDFDIDADGEADRIAFVGGASGFLALDRNGIGRIDDGSALFGARTGNGFAELAAFDSDGNGWIDENDAIFAQLRIWTKDASGADQLSTLAEHDIGALYLGSAATPFDLKDAHNQQHGQILSSGVYLREVGRSGTIQQLDLFVLVAAMLTQAEKFQHFVALHQGPGAFVIPNPWDAGSARILASMGFRALATTSAGFAFSKGKRDSFNCLDRDEMLANAAEIVAATDLPVSADLGNGFGPEPETCAQTIRLAYSHGLVGGSIEDASGNADAPIYAFDHAVA